MVKTVQVGGAEWAADVIVVVGRRGSGTEWAAGAIVVVGRRGSGTGAIIWVTTRVSVGRGTYTPLAQFGFVVRCHEIRHRCVRRRSRTREHRRFRRFHAIVEQKRRASVFIEDGENAVKGEATCDKRDGSLGTARASTLRCVPDIRCCGARVRGRSGFPDFHTGICHPASRARAPGRCP